MMSTHNLYSITSFCALLLLLIATPCVADKAFEAVITGDQVVPSTISGAYGTITLILNEEETEAAYTVIFAGLEGSQTAAHFHNAPSDGNGPIIYDLPMGTPLAGFWELSPMDAVELNAGRVYVLIYTDLFPDGEIRGNLSLTMVEADQSSWGGIKALYR